MDTPFYLDALRADGAALAAAARIDLDASVPSCPGWSVADLVEHTGRAHREHAKGAVAVRATASDLVLLLWKRADPSGTEVFGDVTLLSRFLSLTDLD